MYFVRKLPAAEKGMLELVAIVEISYSRKESANTVYKSVFIIIMCMFILIEEKICPSSIAAYFSSGGHKVSLCQPRFSKQILYNVKVPEYFPDGGDDNSALELTEWLGAFSIGADL
jgi:hypothetical protein